MSSQFLTTWINTHSNPSHIQEKKKTEAAIKRIIPEGVDVSEIAEELSHNVDVIALVGLAKNNADTYLGEDEKKCKRIYKVENPKQATKIKKSTAVKVLKQDAFKNSRTMALSIGIFGGLGSIGWIGGPIAGGAGTGTGIAIGLGVGGYFIKKRIDKKISIQIQICDHYAEWRTKAIVDKVYPIFKNFLDTDSVFKEYFCPLSNDLCSIPMKAPDGRTYEKAAIEDYIRCLGVDDDTPIKSPTGGKSFCKNDLIVDSTYCRNLITEAQNTHEKVIVYGKENEIKYGIEAVTKNTKELMEKIRIHVEFQLFQDYSENVKNKVMTQEQRGIIIEKSSRQWQFV